MTGTPFIIRDENGNTLARGELETDQLPAIGAALVGDDAGFVRSYANGEGFAITVWLEPWD